MLTPHVVAEAWSIEGAQYAVGMRGLKGVEEAETKARASWVPRGATREERVKSVIRQYKLLTGGQSVSDL